MTDLVERLRAALDADNGPFAEAHRKILDLHEVLVRDGVPGFPTEYACTICEVDNYEGPSYGPDPACDTVLALAEAYGVEA